MQMLKKCCQDTSRLTLGWYLISNEYINNSPHTSRGLIYRYTEWIWTLVIHLNSTHTEETSNTSSTRSLGSKVTLKTSSAVIITQQYNESIIQQNAPTERSGHIKSTEPFIHEHRECSRMPYHALCTRHRANTTWTNNHQVKTQNNMKGTQRHLCKVT